MECNKEEALRAMDIAEKKMEKKDFDGAKKIAEKAQRLYTDLPNVSQMILVCEVHCASQSKLYGNELDWYGVLQIERAADEVAIKKQFRKLALSLHPDKNNFPGAADAFKMIGEAQKVLTDRTKRLIYDSKCKAAGKVQAHGRTQNATGQTNARGHPWFQSSFVKNVASQSASQPQPPTQPVDLDAKAKFWTACPYCSTRYMYYRELLNKNLRCQKCKKEFAGYEMSAPPDNLRTNSVFPQPTATAAKKGKSATRRKRDTNVKSPVPEKKFSPGASHSKRNRKKRNLSEDDFIDSTDSDSSSDINDDDMVRQNFGSSSDQNLRRSGRSRQHVSYDYGKDASDDDMPKSDEIEVEDHPSDKRESAGAEENNREAKRKKVSSADEISRNGDSGTEKTQAPEDDGSTEPRDVEYPEPDFSNFEKDREEKCFAAGQMWAIYDTLDAMPRFYAIVRKVLSPSFNLRITWFEADPDGIDEKKWVTEGLPAGCGKFRLGSTEITDVHGMFSHQVTLERAGRREKYKMYPRKGETWALFKGWDMNWHSDSQKKTEFEYEFVEVLSGYDEDSGAQVAYLGKLKGFACLFCRIVKDGVGCFVIPGKDLFRFSHKVPSFQMSGNERLDVPQGSFELDPGSLPRNLEEIDVLTAFSMDPSKMNPPNGSCSVPYENAQEPMDDDKAREAATAKTLEELFSETSKIEDLVDEEIEMEPEPATFTDNAFQDAPNTEKEAESDIQNVPEPEFYNFDADKAIEKFRVDQVWAVYGDEDALPKYYGKIRKIDSPPKFAVHLSWLLSVPPHDIIPWTDKNMPACCGEYKLCKKKPQLFASTGPFSHQMRAIEEKNVYRVYPQKGEIWALFKDWKPSLTCDDLDTCNYEPVEVVVASNLETTILVLEAVPGHKSVFKPRVEGNSSVIRRIPRQEMLRFSHQVPAFQLTEEKNGSLRGFWELDPAALPIHFFGSS